MGNINSVVVSENRQENLSSTRFTSIQLYTGLIRHEVNPFKRLKLLSCCHLFKSPISLLKV